MVLIINKLFLILVPIFLIVLSLFNYYYRGDYSYIYGKKIYIDEINIDDKYSLFNNKLKKKRGDYIFKGRN